MASAAVRIASAAIGPAAGERKLGSATQALARALTRACRLHLRNVTLGDDARRDLGANAQPVYRGIGRVGLLVVALVQLDDVGFVAVREVAPRVVHAVRASRPRA